MIKVSTILQQKGSSVWTISPEATILDALIMMAKKNVGALVVEENGEVCGIVSERDYARKTAKNRSSDLISPVREYMTSEVHTVTPEQTLDDCMAWMTREHIRHLPVVDGKQLLGIISIGDVVKNLIDEKSTTIDEMENYILGRGYVRK
jgi:CBS domain-containing protein